MASPDESPEQAFLRKSMDASSRMSYAWGRLGAGGKVFLVLLYVGYALPFLLQVGLFVFFLLYVYPTAPTWFDWWLALVALFGFLTVIAFEVRRYWGFLLQLVLRMEKPRGETRRDPG